MPNLPRNKFKVKSKSMQGRGEQTKKDYPQYHTVRWRKIRLEQLTEHPLCCECLKQKINTIANVCDHKTPVKDMMLKGLDFWEASQPDNLQSMCTPCHNKKSAKEKR
jgi:5-methylcytosine-specific restriction protein A